MSDTIIRIPLISRRAAVAGGLAALGSGGFAEPQTEKDAGACLLTPHATEGPYYFDPKLERADITGGKGGSPVRLVIGVQDAACEPLKGARVDIWHCDAQGAYSGYAGGGQDDARGETFLRGHQTTDARGEAAFTTIYPGWYPGRTTHIHLKVILDDNAVMTSQLYFPEELNHQIYRLPAYYRSGQRTTLNTNDGIARDQGRSAFASVTPQSQGHLVKLLVGVDPAARASRRPPA